MSSALDCSHEETSNASNKCAPLTVSLEQLLPSVRMMYRSALRGQLRGLPRTADC